jgi:hypothetical protein
LTISSGTFTVPDSPSDPNPIPSSSAYSYDETAAQIVVTLPPVPASVSSADVRLSKILPRSITSIPSEPVPLGDPITGTQAVDEIVRAAYRQLSPPPPAAAPPTTHNPALLRNILLLLNKNGGISLEAGGERTAGVFLQEVEWDSLFYSIEEVGEDEKRVSLEFEKVDLIERWSKRNFQESQDGTWARARARKAIKGGRSGLREGRREDQLRRERVTEGAVGGRPPETPARSVGPAAAKAGHRRGSRGETPRTPPAAGEVARASHVLSVARASHERALGCTRVARAARAHARLHTRCTGAPN